MKRKAAIGILAIFVSVGLLTACAGSSVSVETAEGSGTAAEAAEETLAQGSAEVIPTEEPEEAKQAEETAAEPIEETVEWDDDWTYAADSEIHSDSVTLYKVSDEAKTIAVNAGHGTQGGESVQTKCHPDGTPKVTGGSTGEGAIYATAVAGGMTMLDGTAESVVTLKLSQILKDKLLESGFNVLMIRESDDVQLDNIARTVFANENADCHLAIHYDSTESDKGFFYISVPDVASYRSMEPVASHWQEHHALGDAILSGMKAQDVKIFGEGSMAIDLTQTSYSTVPSVDLEVGDAASDYSEETMEVLADGIVEGVRLYYGEE